MKNSAETATDPLVLDVRPILEAGQSPCNAIDEAVLKLRPGQDFVLLAPFEPTPLFAKLGREGFTHTKQLLADNAWRIVFQKPPSCPPTNRVTPKGTLVSQASASQTADIRLDNRGLEPPEPLVRTLEAADRLRRDQRLVMLSDRKPVNLFEELEARGFAYDCGEQPDRSFMTTIWRA